jgi:isopenicillin N synthase-like dioxygenase
MSQTLPIIDVRDYLSGKPGALAATAGAVREALTQVGFFLLTGHDVPAALIQRTFAEAERFHAQPMDRKLAWRMNEHNNGYMAMARYAVWTSEVNRNDKPDLNEAFFIKRERADDDPLGRSGRRFLGPNIWPQEAELPGFRQHVLDYTDAVDSLACRCLPAVAVALDLPADYFAAAFAESQFSFRLSHYPPAVAEPNQFGIAPHTDANFLTFLALTEVPGLQIRMPDGLWRDVPYLPGAFAVNSGDTMRRWTNKHFLSTPHRVLPPVGRHRYAIPFFLGPHVDTLIACLPGCQDAARPAAPPIRYGDWLAEWYTTNYNPRAQANAVA